MAKVIYLVCDSCGKAMPEGIWLGWWTNIDGTVHFCPNCCEAVRKTLKVDEFVVSIGIMNNSGEDNND